MRKCARQPWRAHHVWGAARSAALDRDQHRCQFCGTTEDLEVHHLHPVLTYEQGCHHHLDGLLTLCADCHRRDHAFMRSGRRWYQPRLPLAA